MSDQEQGAALTNESLSHEWIEKRIEDEYRKYDAVDISAAEMAAHKIRHTFEERVAAAVRELEKDIKYLKKEHPKHRGVLNTVRNLIKNRFPAITG